MKYFLSRRPGDPYIPPRNPFQTFMLMLSVVASAPLLVGTSGSPALEDRLSNTAVEGWGYALLIGSVMALVGSWLPRSTASPRRTWAGWNVERAGLILVAGAAALYTAIIVGVAGSVNDVRYAACIQVAYVAACIWRVFQVSLLMKWYKEWVLLQAAEE